MYLTFSIAVGESSVIGSSSSTIYTQHVRHHPNTFRGVYDIKSRLAA